MAPSNSKLVCAELLAGLNSILTHLHATAGETYCTRCASEWSIVGPTQKVYW